jgi:hypothetical protein
VAAGDFEGILAIVASFGNLETRAESVNVPIFAGFPLSIQPLSSVERVVGWGGRDRTITFPFASALPEGGRLSL